MIRYTALITTILLWFLFMLSFVCVSDNNVGIIIREGAAQGFLKPGYHFINPLKDSVRSINISTQKIEVKSSSVTGDLRTVKSTSVVSFRVNPEYADELCMYSGRLDSDFKIKIITVPSYVNMLVVPSVQESINNVVARFSAELLVGNQEELKVAIIDNLTQKLSPHGIVIEDLLITSLEME